jgi:IrrE N-terminal-like domain
VPAFRITVNDRLETSQRFFTIAHELAHIFCGHLGSCPSRNAQNGDESGWPDRQKFGKHEKEIEAEAAAFLIASRAGLIARSAAYLAAYVPHADMKQQNLPCNPNRRPDATDRVSRDHGVIARCTAPPRARRLSLLKVGGGRDWFY